jgi:hypothetical protein
MTAHSATQADGRFLHRILILLIVATLSSGALAAISIAKSQEPDKATVVTQQS